MVGHVFRTFFRISWHLRSVYLVQLALMFAGGVAIAIVEQIPIGDAIYFASITGLTVGYGDIVAHSTAGRVISVFIGFVGLLFTGLVVAIAVSAVREAWQQTQRPG